MTEAEVVRDIVAVLEKVRQGIEVVVKENHQAVTVIRAPAADLGNLRPGSSPDWARLYAP